jgi:hypothetical protein
MQWLQGTFSTRFNRLRGERGHLFQGRYKSLLVDPAGGLGPLCHYIHLNPVRARLCAVAQVPEWPWTSLRCLMQPKLRAAWYDPSGALEHAGGLKDTPAGRRKYGEYLAWLAEDEPAQKEQRFADMSKGWLIGTAEFAKALVKEQQARAGEDKPLPSDLQAAQEAVWLEMLEKLLKKLKRTPADLANEGKSVAWKLAVAATLKSRTTVTNRWLGVNLNLGNLHEVSRKVAAWSREPDVALLRRLAITPNPKA